MAINIPQPSLRKACHSQRAFTMTELIIVVGIIGVLLAVGVPRYSQQVREYRLQAITARLATWLDEQRRLAIQQAGPCAISINTSTATFDASVNDTGITNDVCGSTASQPRDSVLRLRNLENGTNNLTLTLLGTTTSPLLFGFRGLSTNGMEVQISLEGSSRCVRVTRPLGLIRMGRVNSGSSNCSYTGM
jgi:hypothetical protein